MRAKPEGNLRGREIFWWSMDILLIINPSTEVDQEIHPCGQGRIDSVKTNPSLIIDITKDIKLHIHSQQDDSLIKDTYCTDTLHKLVPS